MNQRGRPPKPTRLKVLNGNAGKRSLPEDEPKPASSRRLPTVPKSLGKAGRSEWRKTGKQLLELGLLTGLDVMAFQLYCEAIDDYEEARKQLENGYIVATPSGRLTISPYYSIQNQALKTIQTYQGQFGMTPASRARLSIKPPEDDEFTEWLFGPGRN